MTDTSGLQNRQRAPTGAAALTRHPYDFSVVLGGPLFPMVCRTHLCGDALELLRRRLLVITLFAWLPLLILSAPGA